MVFPVTKNVALLLASVLIALGGIGAEAWTSTAIEVPALHIHLWDTQASKSRTWKNAVYIKHTDDAPGGVSFLDEKSVLTYHVVSTAELAQRHNLAEAGSHRLDVQIFDLASSRMLRQKSWPTRRNWSFALGTARGFLVRRENELASYNANFEQVAQILIAPQTGGVSLVRISPSGETVMVNKLSRFASEIDIYDATTLRSRYSFQLRPSNSYSTSDTALISPDIANQHVLLRPFESDSWKEVGVPARRGCVASPVFATDSTIVNALCDVLVLSTSGRVLLRDLPQQTSNDEIAISRSGQFIAVALATGKGGGFWDTNIRTVALNVSVYSIEKQRSILNVPLSPMPVKNCDFALSPDGSKLAILSDGDLSVYSVPPPN